jgi:ferritin-like metal-binding protein YciE
MPNESSVEILKRYLQDAIASEQNFESQLKSFSHQGDQVAVQKLFAEHAEQTKSHHERLTARLEAMGGKPSTMKSMLAHVFNFAPKAAQMGHEPTEKSSQDLIIGYAIESSEVAMYEELAIVAGFAGDSETEELAREIQQEERAAAQNIWNLIDASCRRSFMKLASNPANVY